MSCSISTLVGMCLSAKAQHNRTKIPLQECELFRIDGVKAQCHVHTVLPGVTGRHALTSDRSPVAMACSADCSAFSNVPLAHPGAALAPQGTTLSPGHQSAAGLCRNTPQSPCLQPFWFCEPAQCLSASPALTMHGAEQLQQPTG